MPVTARRRAPLARRRKRKRRGRREPGGRGAARRCGSAGTVRERRRGRAGAVAGRPGLGGGRGGGASLRGPTAAGSLERPPRPAGIALSVGRRHGLCSGLKPRTIHVCFEPRAAPSCRGAAQRFSDMVSSHGITSYSPSFRFSVLARQRERFKGRAQPERCERSVLAVIGDLCRARYRFRSFRAVDLSSEQDLPLGPGSSSVSFALHPLPPA